MIATNPNIIGFAVGVGVLLGAGVVLMTLWIMQGGRDRGYRP